MKPYVEETVIELERRVVELQRTIQVLRVEFPGLEDEPSRVTLTARWEAPARTTPQRGAAKPRRQAARKTAGRVSYDAVIRRAIGALAEPFTAAHIGEWLREHAKAETRTMGKSTIHTAINRLVRKGDLSETDKIKGPQGLAWGYKRGRHFNDMVHVSTPSAKEEEWNKLRATIQVPREVEA